MSGRNAAAKGLPDANHPEIVAQYEELYCSVIDLHGIGFGCPDILVGIAQSVNELVEIKTEFGTVEKSQVRFQRDWRGSKVTIVRTRADVIHHVQRVRERISRGIR